MSAQASDSICTFFVRRWPTSSSSYFSRYVPPQVPPYETHLTMYHVQLDFFVIGRFVCHFPRNPRLTYTFLSQSIETVLHSTLVCRLMIGIREANQSSGYRLETFELSQVPHHTTLEFARRPLDENPWMDPEVSAGPSKA